jgi:hypothetical protein
MSDPAIYTRPLLPIYIKNHSRNTFLMDSRVPDRVVTTEAGTFRTRPLKLGGIDLLGACAVHEIGVRYPTYSTDCLGVGTLKVRSVFVVNPRGEIIEVEVNVPFTKSTEGNYIDQQVWATVALPVKYGEPWVADSRLSAKVNPETGILAWALAPSKRHDGWAAVGIVLDGEIWSHDRYEQKYTYAGDAHV